MNQEAFQRLLREQLTLSQSKNPSYSIRAFAKKLGLGLGTVSEALAGKRVLSPKSVIIALDRLDIGPVERARILKGPKQKLSYAQTQLQADQYFILSEWHYLAILNLVRTRNFKPNVAHISERLGISAAVAKQSLDRLIRVNLLQVKNKKLVRTSVALNTTDGIPHLAIRKAHYETLDRARLAMDEHPFETFDLSSLTFAFDEKDMSAAKQKIRDFQEEFAEQFSTSKNAGAVYRLAVQLFSLTRRPK